MNGPLARSLLIRAAVRSTDICEYSDQGYIYRCNRAQREPKRNFNSTTHIRPFALLPNSPQCCPEVATGREISSRRRQTSQSLSRLRGLCPPLCEPKSHKPLNSNYKQQGIDQTAKINLPQKPVSSVSERSIAWKTPTKTEPSPSPASIEPEQKQQPSAQPQSIQSSRFDDLHTNDVKHSLSCFATASN